MVHVAVNIDRWLVQKGQTGACSGQHLPLACPEGSDWCM